MSRPEHAGFLAFVCFLSVSVVIEAELIDALFVVVVVAAVAETAAVAAVATAAAVVAAAASVFAVAASTSTLATSALSVVNVEALLLPLLEADCVDVRQVVRRVEGCCEG